MIKDSGNEPMWVEKQPDKQVPDTSVQSQPAVVKGPTLQVKLQEGGI